jgi:hypothetical protein
VREVLADLMSIWRAGDTAGVGTVQQGSFLGYRVTVCDARPMFATPSRFPSADEVVVDWPHRYLAAQVETDAIDGRTVICVLTHDPKFDVPVLTVALRLAGLAWARSGGAHPGGDRGVDRRGDHRSSVGWRRAAIGGARRPNSPRRARVAGPSKALA